MCVFSNKNEGQSTGVRGSCRATITTIHVIVKSPKCQWVAYLIPIFGVIWGCLFLKEPITLSVLVGGSVVVVGTILVTRSARFVQARIATE